MTNRVLLAGLSATLLTINAAWAQSAICYSIEGFIQIAPAEAFTCPLVEENGDRFNVEFAFDYVNNPGGADATCFSSQIFEADINVDGDSIPLGGTTESALSLNFPFGFPSAASAIIIQSPKAFKGKIFTVDFIFFGQFGAVAGEQLQVVSGNRAYRYIVTEAPNASSIQIVGDAFQGAPFTGRICLE